MERRDVETYLGIQRPLRNSRVLQLAEYVNFKDATFPTSIVIAVDERTAEYDKKTKTMTLKNVTEEDDQGEILFRKIARVLDGQHRIAGLNDFYGEDFELNVTIFVGIDIAAQAQIFSTVNLEQTKVSKSLAYDLYELAKKRSPQKTCHNVAVALDGDRNSPFFQRIKRLGSATPGRSFETLTQAAVVESMIGYISLNPRKDRDYLLRGRKLPAPTAEELQIVPLRGLFIEGKDVEIAKLIWNYFDAVRKKWPEAWVDQARGNMLNKTNGFKAFMKVFSDVYLFVAGPGDMVSSKRFGDLLDNVKLNDSDFNTDNYKPGSSGQSGLSRDLREQMGLDNY